MPAEETRLEADRRKALGLAIAQIEKQLGKGGDHPLAVEYWPTEDPTAVEGNREQRLDAYRAVRDQLMKRIQQRFGTTTAAPV